MQITNAARFIIIILCLLLVIPVRGLDQSAAPSPSRSGCLELDADHGRRIATLPAVAVVATRHHTVARVDVYRDGRISVIVAESGQVRHCVNWDHDCELPQSTPWIWLSCERTSIMHHVR